MIFVYHNSTKVVKVENQFGEPLIFNARISIAEVLSLLADNYTNEKLVWCHIKLKESLNIEALERLSHHDKLMLSYQSDTTNYLNSKIGYVEDSPFINVNKEVSYPTWQMSSRVGIINTSILRAINGKIPFDTDFDYYLNSVAKLAMPMGLLCYSEPKLVKDRKTINPSISSNFTLFRFVKQHYKTRWIFLLLFNIILYEGKFPLLPFFLSLFYKKRDNTIFNLDSVKIKSTRSVVNNETIDVVIPTIGRKKYLYDVLKDLAKQSKLPEKVIIVEQNPVSNSVSDLDYLKIEKWPFIIKHIFTHQPGACNARNLALQEVESEWVFLADDDILFSDDFFQKVLDKIKLLGVKAVSINCIKKGEKQFFESIFQWKSFGSGCSFVSSEMIKELKFNLGFEFGFGEDTDFGMQIRNLGYDILYLPEPKIEHLKAPIGGFRTKPELKWSKDSIQPKPSPTVMLYQISHNTRQQILGYKTTLFLKYYSYQNIKNPISYLKTFNKQWNQSLYWATQLKSES